MSEIVLKIGTVAPDPAYQDGDIVDTFNRRRIRCVHAEHICHLKNFGFNSDGLRPNTLAQIMQEFTRQYKFERVKSVVRRINLITLEEEVFGEHPNDKGEYIFIDEYLNRAIKHHSHIIYGTKEREYWFGGNTDVSHAKLDLVWEEIEARTAEREINYQRWPLSGIEKTNFLALEVDDFDETESNDLKSSEYDVSAEEDESPIMLQKRKNMVNWELLSLPVSIRKIRDKGVQVDLREMCEFKILEIVSRKADLTIETQTLPFTEPIKPIDDGLIGISNVDGVAA